MEESDVRERFAEFAAPLSAFVALGGRKEALEELARNLWIAMLAGRQAEEEMWIALGENDAGLCQAVKRCYFEKMKPLVSETELTALRQRYGLPEG